MNYYELQLLNIKLIYFIKSISEYKMNEWHIMIFENVTQLKIFFIFTILFTIVYYNFFLTDDEYKVPVSYSILPGVRLNSQVYMDNLYHRYYKHSSRSNVM